MALTSTDIEAITALVRNIQTVLLEEDTSDWEHLNSAFRRNYGNDINLGDEDGIKRGLEDLSTFCSDPSSGYTEVVFVPHNSGYSAHILLTTTDVILQGINLGAFNIKIKIPKPKTDAVIEAMTFQNIVFIAQKPVHSNNPHPHISGSSLCFGEGSILMQTYLGQGNYLALAMLMRSILNTYNPGSPFRKLEYYKPVQYTCRDCSLQTATASEVRKCQGCGDYYCRNCKLAQCVHCERLFCKKCTLLDIYKAIKDKRIYPACANCLGNRVVMTDSWTGKRSEIRVQGAANYDEARWDLEGTLDLIMETFGEEYFSHLSSSQILNVPSPARYLICAVK